jgi:hypothetical protein
MTIETILNELDLQIARLQQVRAILANDSTKPSKKQAPTTKAKSKKRVLSAEARARIAAAQRKRWAAQKKAAK